MCRIAVGSTAFNRQELKLVFDYLERSNGGDGNGVLLENGNRVAGLKLSPSKAAKLVRRRPPNERFVFHTRLKSTGGVTAEALHPVVIPGGGWLVQNGTWSAWRSYYDGTASTDTLAIAELVGEHGIGVLMSQQLSNAGIFVHVSPEWEITFVKRTGRPMMLHLDRRDPRRWLYASEDVSYLLNGGIVRYDVIKIADNTAFVVGKDGMPTPVSIAPRALQYKAWRGTSYGHEYHYNTSKDWPYAKNGDKRAGRAVSRNLGYGKGKRVAELLDQFVTSDVSGEALDEQFRLWVGADGEKVDCDVCPLYNPADRSCTEICPMGGGE